METGREELGMRLAKTMQAVQITGPRIIRCGELEVPVCREDEVLVKVHCLGVCATDLEIYQGTMVYFQTNQSSFPVIPGHEWSGEIIALGSEVQDFNVGDRVVGETTIACGHCSYCQKGRYNLCPKRLENGVLGKDGAAAEYMVYPAHALHRFDASLSYEEACLIEPAAVAFRGVSKISITPEDTVAVIGAGPVGLLAVQMAKAFGAKKSGSLRYPPPPFGNGVTPRCGRNDECKRRDKDGFIYGGGGSDRKCFRCGIAIGLYRAGRAD